MRTSGIINKILKYVLVTVCWLVLWEIIFLIVNNQLFISSPQDVFIRIIVLAKTKKFWIAVGLSILRVFIGYVCGIFFGTLFAVLSCKDLFKSFLSPIRTVIKATPVQSFIMLAWIWLKRDNIPPFVGTIMVIPVVWGNIYSSIKSIKKHYLDFAQSYQLSFYKKIRYVYIPQIIPNFSAALYTCAGLVWKAEIAAEVLCTPKNSIGYHLLNAKSTLETLDVFVWTTVVIIISLIFEKIVKKLIGLHNASLPEDT